MRILRGEDKMKYKNLKITKYMTALALTTTLSLTSLTGCGNKQRLDFNKAFNIAVEVNGENVSVAGIKSYSDYSGTQIQFVTNDDLRVVSSTHQTQLIKSENKESFHHYILALSGNKEENIINYGDLEGKEAEIDFHSVLVNKDKLDWHWTYNKAIILSDGTATIVTIETWKDYDDDKIQIKLSDGTCILTEIDKVKLVNDENANETSLKSYAITLVGSEENVVEYDAEKVNTK